uniref:SWIM-type domain-containing protein n=1 Tax=Fagus sylvatica TaxID=28930 RepID=A0A2N9GT96_FAGSY
MAGAPFSAPTPPPSISSTHDRPSITVTLRRRSSSSIPAPRTHGYPSREEGYFPIFVPWNGLEHYLICPLKDCMWAAARATNMAEFKIEMEKIKKLNMKAWEWLEAVEKEFWTRAKFRTNSKCDALTNNGIQNKLEVEKSNSREWVPTCCGDKSLSKFEVTYKGNICGKQYIVDIEHKTCSCGAWDLSGIPCAHSIAALASDDHNIEDYVHTCYSAVSFAQAYGPCVYPINGPDLWPRNDREIPLPPPWRRQAGHNKRRCKDATDEANKATTQANKTKRVRRKNATATGVSSSSQIEPTNGVASLSQEPPPAPQSEGIMDISDNVPDHSRGQILGNTSLLCLDSRGCEAPEWRSLSGVLGSL